MFVFSMFKVLIDHRTFKEFRFLLNHLFDLSHFPMFAVHNCIICLKNALLHRLSMRICRLC